MLSARLNPINRHQCGLLNLSRHTSLNHDGLVATDGDESELLMSEELLFPASAEYGNCDDTRRMLCVGCF